MNSRSLVVVIILAFVIVLIGGAFLSLGGSSKSSVTSGNNPVATKTLIEVNDILGDPIVYNELTVEVESQVSDWVTKKSFKVSTPGGAFEGSGPPLLVIGKNQFSIPADSNSSEFGIGEKVRLHMKGKVVIITKDQLQNYLGENLDSDIFKALDGSHLNTWTLGPVLLLDSVKKI